MPPFPQVAGHVVLFAKVIRDLLTPLCFSSLQLDNLANACLSNTSKNVGDPADTIPAFPNQTTLFGGAFEVPSATFTPSQFNQILAGVPIHCPYPLVVPDDPKGELVNFAEGGSCAAPCPLPLYTPAQYEYLDHM